MIRDNIELNASVKPNTAFQEKLKETLPEFYSANKYDEEGNLIEEGKFDLEKFQRALREKNVDELTNGYKLDFIGKDYAKKQSGEHPTTVIVPDNDHNNLKDNINSNNLFFTGDNLEVLRHLQNNYDNSIDMIYIDPPYNTGSDGFIYPDSFEYSDQNLKDMFGLNEKELDRMKSIQGKSTHSSWLAFIYPRLCLASKLLNENGVIFVSIDDNEFVNLNHVMNEVFGESNFISILPRITSPQRFHQEKNINISHDYVVVYGKTAKSCLGNLVSDDKLSNKDLMEDNIGKYYVGDTKAILAPASQGYSSGGDYDFKYNGKIYKPVDSNGVRNRWFWNKDRMQAAADLGILVETANGGIRMQVYQDMKFEEGSNKMVPKEMGVRLTSRDLLGNKYSNPNGVSDLSKHSLDKYFTNPKPVDLLKTLIRLIKKKDCLILDFFSGSSTTAEAVMQLNANDGGIRRHIMVQLDERIYTENDKGIKVPKKGSKDAFGAGYYSIDEISRERIKRASEKIKDEKGLTLPDNFDAGFKHYRVVAPNQLTLNDIESYDIESGMFMDASGHYVQLTESGFDDMIQPFSSEGLQISGNASGEDSILTTWMVSDGYRFDINANEIDVNGYSAYYVDNTRLYIIKKGWTAKQTREVVNLIGTNQLTVQTIVLYGYSFDLESIRELEIALKQLDNKVNLIKRY